MHETRNFKQSSDPKLACSCCGKGGASIALLIVLEDLRRHFATSVNINCCARCKSHNSSVGGVKSSEHLVNEENNWESDAADITVQGVSPKQVYMYLKEKPYANLLGLGQYATFTHVDTRGYGARW